MKKIILLVLMVLPFTLFAQQKAVDKITIKLDFTPNVQNGKEVFGICARCHLPEAWGNEDGTYPQLAGQHVNVLMKQLLDIRTGKRHSPLMYPFVQERTIGGYQELSDVVAYLSTLPMKPKHLKGPWYKTTAEYKEGKKIYQHSCAQCHGKSGSGKNALYYPRLNGQQFHYMKRQLIKIKNKLRLVDPEMEGFVQGLSEDQIEKVVNYISYLPVKTKLLAPNGDWRNPDFIEQ